MKAGQTLGPFEILEPLGAGGMGEVWLARDTRLGRRVALKMLPPAVAADPEFLARLQREAQVLASLNHPGIAAIHDVEVDSAPQYLVLELVEGETLEEHARTRLSVDAALQIGRQIAAALEAAHGKGIVHRDLKPANVKITPEGKVKILDFGLAKAIETGPAPDLADSPTILDATGAGVILGTAPYMSPEQARGRPVDRRTDIWAFGCVLYELLAGRRAFPGETVSDTLAAIIHKEPDWDALPRETPPRVRTLLRRCLAKDLERRLRDIGDALLELQEAEEHAETPPIPAGARRRTAVGWGAAGLLVGAALVLGATAAGILGTDSGPEPGPAGPARFSLVPTLPGESAVEVPDKGGLAISPDGRQIVLPVRAGDRSGLWLHDFDTGRGHLLPRTENGMVPFFAPDGARIGFFEDDQARMYALSLDGGNRTLVTESEDYFRDPRWHADGIYLAHDFGSPISRVDPDGGDATPLWQLDAAHGERLQSGPTPLPDGGFLYTSQRGPVVGLDPVIVARPGQGGEPVEITDGFAAHYLTSGHLVFQRGSALYAARFDPHTHTLLGAPVQMLGDVYTDIDGHAGYALAEDGTLAVRPIVAPVPEEHTLSWIAQDGEPRVALRSPNHLATPVLSPDGTQVAVAALVGSRYQIWVGDPARGIWTPLVTEGSSINPIWSPDGREIAYSSDVGGTVNVFVRGLDGSAPRQITSSDAASLMSDWSPDGSTIVYFEDNSLFLQPLADGSRPRRFVGPAGEPWSGVFSPDGRWLAYASIDSGGDSVYVRPLDGDGQVARVSTGVSYQPVWAPDGSALYFLSLSEGTLVRVDVDWSSGAPRFSSPVSVRPATWDTIGNAEEAPDFDVAADGTFLVVTGEHPQPADRVDVFLGWGREIERALAEVPGISP